MDIQPLNGEIQVPSPARLQVGNSPLGSIARRQGSSFESGEML